MRQNGRIINKPKKSKKENDPNAKAEEIILYSCNWLEEDWQNV